MYNDSMHNKKLLLFALLSLLTILFSFTLSQLDLFGFLDGRNTISFTYLILTLVFSYAIMLVVFILDFSDKKNLIKAYVGQALLFGLIYAISSFDITLSFLNSAIYYALLNFINTQGTKRSKLFIKFIPSEIFFPVLRKAFLFIVIFFAITNFFRTHSLISSDSLLTPSITRYVTRPIILILNKQIGAQLEQQLGDRFQTAIGTKERHRIVSFVLKELVESMGEGQVRQTFGFTPQNIPVDKVIVYDNGDIDITPVIDAMLPDMTVALNKKIANYVLIAPFAIAFITIFIFSALLIPVQLFESLVSLLIFKILISSGFLEIIYEKSDVERITL